MIRCEAKTTGEDNQNVDITLSGDTCEVVCELAAICATVIQELEPKLKVSVGEFVNGLADMVLEALTKEGENTND